ncbi:hypothetical protein V8G54_020663 [Vigna mungo]|uniref:Uncharacterized protein n=1 Tax=Vigna mungo TaxID=3915 RepID=A0AAQ3NCV7_VIGMU
MIEYNVDVGSEEVAPFAEGIEEGGEGEELDEGVPADGERIEVVVGQAEEVHGEDAVSVDVLLQERIEVEEIVGEAEEVHGEVAVSTDVHGEEVDGIEVDENDVQRTEAAEVELQTPSIEVDRAEADGIEVQANTSEVDRAEAGEVEVEAEKDGEMDDVQVGDWSSTQESDGEMDNEDGLVDIDVQCHVSESCSDLEVEVEPFLPGSDSDMDELDIDDSSWFNDD